MNRTGLGLVLGVLGLACASTSKQVQPFEPIEEVLVPLTAELNAPALFYRPIGNGPFPAVVLMHNCAGVGGTNTPMQNVAWLLREAGYVVLVPDSFFPRNIGFVCDDPERKSPTSLERVEDAFAAKRYLSSLALVDPKRIGLVGWSHGATTAAIAWAKNAGVSDSPPFAAVAAYYPYCFTQDISSPSVPLLIFSGELDDWCPANRCKQLVDSATELGHHDVNVTIYPGATHSFDATPGGTSFNVLGHQLKQDPAAAKDSRAKLLAFFERTLKKM